MVESLSEIKVNSVQLFGMVNVSEPKLVNGDEPNELVAVNWLPLESDFAQK